MSIHLPQTLQSKLVGHNHEQGIVHSSISTFGRWFEASGSPVFFRDYTDHGVNHVSNVLATAAAMITNSAEVIVSAADVTLLVAGTLHDAALHIAEPGFHQLIHADAKERMIKEFDDQPWPSLWEEFLFSARRWDDHKRADILGIDTVPADYLISDPFDRWGNLTAADYRLIGEFIRRHHPRLAHEFAVFGVPGTTADAITLPTDMASDWRYLAGLIGRSHGSSMRDCLERMPNRYHRRDYQSVHIAYLMALLRLSDYLQLDASRASDIVFRYRVLPSRISALEWRAHNAVKNITPEHEDPESVEINAEPPDVATYLRVRSWLDGLQNELDTTWAVLGEVYGRYPNLRDLGVHWRRVRSNLDQQMTFAETVTYLPRRIRMEVARSELLSLLIRPLYGDDPSYGIRELMQNAVDAVREREHIEKNAPGTLRPPFRQQEADVVVWLDDLNSNDYAWFEISDRGIGMNEKVLTDYFLTAGASYRHSDQWQRTFERADLPRDAATPRAQILRSGRFGVGALAAFLLGDEIEVETRHITSDVGFRFRMHLSEDAVQVERIRNLPAGTKIRIPVRAAEYDKLKKLGDTVSRPAAWDWYVLDHPTVARVVGPGRRALQGRVEQDLRTWVAIKTQLPLKVFWKHVPRNSLIPMLSCNGIFVSRAAKLPEIPTTEYRSSKVRIRMPALQVMDADGILPLGLTRKDVVSDQYGFEHELYLSIMHTFFARLFMSWPEKFDADTIQKLLDEHPFQKKRIEL